MMTEVAAEFVQCAQCKRVNRSAARFCMRCGTALSDVLKWPDPVANPARQFRDRRRQWSLRDLRVPGEANIWGADRKALYIHVTDAGAGSVYRIDTQALVESGASEGAGAGADRRLGPAPAAASLVAPLLVTRHGVFCVAGDSIVWFKAHGGAPGFRAFERHAWHPADGESIVAAAADAFGEIWVAIRSQSGRLSICRGNGQYSEWVEVGTIDGVELPAGQGAMLAVVRADTGEGASVGLAVAGKVAYLSAGASTTKQRERIDRIPLSLSDRVAKCGLPAVGICPRMRARTIDVVPLAAESGLLGTAVLETSSFDADIADLDPSSRPICTGWDGWGDLVAIFPHRVVTVGDGATRIHLPDPSQGFGTRDAPKAFGVGAAGNAIALLYKDVRSNVASIRLLKRGDGGANLEAAVLSTRDDRQKSLTSVPLSNVEKGVFQPSQFLPPLTTSAGLFLFIRAESPTLIYSPLA